jgi:TonB family protein
VFRENLRARLCGEVVPSQQSTSPPDASFWIGVDLSAPWPAQPLRASAGFHSLLIFALVAVSLWPGPHIRLADEDTRRAFSNAHLVSPFLPELHGSPVTHNSPRKAKGKPDPVLARQEILSLPPNPDNLHQTIVTEPRLTLPRDIALPNLVALDPARPAPSIDESSKAALHKLPSLLPKVAAPAVDASAVSARRKLPSLLPQVAAPAPDVSVVQPRLAVPMLQPRIVQPAPEVGDVGSASAARVSQLLPGAAPIPPAPQIADVPRRAGALLALSLHPADVQAPVKPPEGNRRGEFAASPKGRTEASGTPGASSSENNGANTGNPAHDRYNAPAGITVSAPPHNAVVAVASSSAPEAPRAAPNPSLRNKLLAAMRSPTSEMPHPPAAIAKENTGEQSEVERRIFHGRRSYALAVNMPNLNAATGSWIIHFSERGAPTPTSPIAAPEVVRKSDPAYPGELMAENIHGIVVLTATIRADGSVTDIVVAKSLEPRLDHNAALALARWVFHPALKNGQPIDLDAVIQVPFRAQRPTGF